MKKQNLISLFFTLALVLGLLTGCGAKSASLTADSSYNEAAQAPAEGALEEGAADAGASLALPENRKWIVTVDMSAETEDLEQALAALNREISALKGYVEDQSVYNGSTLSSRRFRSASLTIRIPAEDADAFAQQVAGFANVVSTSKSLEDVTLQYTDTESRIAALNVEQTRLLELLENAETMADLLEIEARLTDVRYQLDNYSSRLRLYNNRIDYATIYLNIEEVQEYTPVEDPTLWQRISTGFLGSLKGLGTGLLDLLVWFIVALPYLLVYGGIGLGIFLLVRKVRKGRASGNGQKSE